MTWMVLLNTCIPTRSFCPRLGELELLADNDNIFFRKVRSQHSFLEPELVVRAYQFSAPCPAADRHDTNTTRTPVVGVTEIYVKNCYSHFHIFLDYCQLPFHRLKQSGRTCVVTQHTSLFSRNNIGRSRFRSGSDVEKADALIRTNLAAHPTANTLFHKLIFAQRSLVGVEI